MTISGQPCAQAEAGEVKSEPGSLNAHNADPEAAWVERIRARISGRSDDLRNFYRREYEHFVSASS